MQHVTVGLGTKKLGFVRPAFDCVKPHPTGVAIEVHARAHHFHVPPLLECRAIACLHMWHTLFVEDVPIEFVNV
jgi:hypothetical protein